jgi:hypothetical protein
MTAYFGEKSRQVEPGDMTAFGIEISSRYGQVQELLEMLRFAELAALKKVSHYVKRAFYDSKANTCWLELDPSVQDGDAVATAIFEAATAALGVFDWFGCVQHGDAVAELCAGSSRID